MAHSDVSQINQCYKLSEKLTEVFGTSPLFRIFFWNLSLFTFVCLVETVILRDRSEHKQCARAASWVV